MKLKHIKHVFFDLDHTLWDFDLNSALTFEKIFKLNDLDIDYENFIVHYTPINLKYWKLYREGKIDKENLRYSRLREAFNSVRIEISDEMINRLSEDYITYLTTFNNLFVGTKEILKTLSTRYNLHIITNGFEEAQQKKLDGSEISQYFKSVTNSESAGVKKPNPIIFNYALNLAKAKPEESIMIGDNYEADILGALDVGLDVILFNYHKIRPDRNIKEIHSLQDLEKFL
ncbi:MAG: YjjG family noncanonical pyrimidine nucleotidase [Bacteroidota bacterium]